MKAVHDMYFTQPAVTFTEFRWRIQLIAELGVGRLLRREQMSEQEAADAVMRQLS